MLAAAVGGMLFAWPVIALFRDDAEVIRIGVVAFRAQCVALAIMPVFGLREHAVPEYWKRRAGGISGEYAKRFVFHSGAAGLPARCGAWWGIQISQMTADLLSAAVTIPMLAGFLRSLPGTGKNRTPGLLDE